MARGLAEPPEEGAPGPFAWAREGAIAETLDVAGFDDIEVDTVEFAMRYPGGVEGWWNNALGTSTYLRDQVGGLDAGGREELLAAFAKRFARHIGPDGDLTVPARTWVAVAGA